MRDFSKRNSKNVDMQDVASLNRYAYACLLGSIGSLLYSAVLLHKITGIPKVFYLETLKGPKITEYNFKIPIEYVKDERLDEEGKEWFSQDGEISLEFEEGVEVTKQDIMDRMRPIITE